MKKNGIVRSVQNKEIIVDNENVYINENITEFVNENDIKFYDAEQTQFSINEYLEFMFIEHKILKSKIEDLTNRLTILENGIIENEN